MLGTARGEGVAKRASATTAEISGSHAIYVSQPGAVVDLITQTAQSLAQTPQPVG